MSHRDIRQILGLELMKKVYNQAARRAGDSLEVAREAPAEGRQAVEVNGSQPGNGEKGSRKSGAALAASRGRGKGRGRGRGRGRADMEVASRMTYEIISDSDEDLGPTPIAAAEEVEVVEVVEAIEAAEVVEGCALLAPSLTLARCGLHEHLTP